MSVEANKFKQAMSRWASGVTVITTLDPDGKPKGMTASSFTSVSLDPPLVLVCVSDHLYTHRSLLHTGHFAVNILGQSQVEWGKLFAGLLPDIVDRFSHTGYTTSATGSPILPDVAGWLDCRIVQQVAAGDHTIFIGEVVNAGISGEDAPLLYAQRAWGRFQPLTTDDDQ